LEKDNETPHPKKQILDPPLSLSIFKYPTNQISNNCVIEAKRGMSILGEFLSKFIIYLRVGTLL